jgi:hypothetical protein
MEKKYSTGENKTDDAKNKIIKSDKNTPTCDCSKPKFQKDKKKECIDCMYKDILYLVP